MVTEVKNILIIKPSALGDIVQAWPVLSALRRAYPGGRISWLVRPEFASLIEGHPHLNEIIAFDRRFLGKAWYNPRAFGALVGLIRKLRRGKFDAVIDLQGLFRTGALGWLSGCNNRFGPAEAREFGHIFYTCKIRQSEDCIHVVDYYLKIAAAVGVLDGKAEFVLPTDSAAEEKVKSLLTEHDIDADNYAVFVPTSAHVDKCWPNERFARLAERVGEEFGMAVVGVGTAGEKGIVDDIKGQADAAVANFAGLTNLPELVALMRLAKLVVSNDTGPGHIAASLGVAVVLIFGRSNPARVRPYGRGGGCVAAIEPDGRGDKADSYAPRHDVKAVTFDEVYGKVCEQINGKKQ